jgi:bifunctional UDP-N-acetylglucosamine pyrophosphorylase/glucosamine-1-phosphate N-acetyltransferase
MKALVLAAGEGTRMKPLTSKLPKPLLPVAGKPCIRHTVDALKKAKVTEIVFVVGFQRKEIQQYLEAIPGIDASFIEQKKRLGTAHAIGMAQTLMKDPFLCLNGDVVATSKTIKGMMKSFKDRGGPVMAVAEVEDPKGYGIVNVDTSTGLVKNILEKPKRVTSKLINTGLYLFTADIFEAIDKTQQSPRGEYEITESISKLQDKASPFQMEEAYIDISVPWDLLTANEFLMEGLKGQVKKGQLESGVTVHGNLVLGKGTTVKSGTYIEGNVIIGEGAKIGPGTYLRGSTYIGDRCHIGGSVEIKNSIVMDDTNIPHHNYVGDSIICRRCNLGSGTKVANLRLDSKPIVSYVKQRPVSTGRRKLGVIMGDDVKTGINAMINVGTVIGPNSVIGPGAVVTGWIEPRSQIF